MRQWPAQRSTAACSGYWRGVVAGSTVGGSVILWRLGFAMRAWRHGRAVRQGPPASSPGSLRRCRRSAGAGEGEVSSASRPRLPQSGRARLRRRRLRTHQLRPNRPPTGQSRLRIRAMLRGTLKQPVAAGRLGSIAGRPFDKVLIWDQRLCGIGHGRHGAAMHHGHPVSGVYPATDTSGGCQGAPQVRQCSLCRDSCPIWPSGSAFAEYGPSSTMQYGSDIAKVEPDESSLRDEFRDRLNRGCGGRDCRVEERGRGRRSGAVEREPEQCGRGGAAKQK
ncbi:hypothetical protein ABIE65_005289 [Constrictibacter sp. MBR-5]